MQSKEQVTIVYIDFTKAFDYCLTGNCLPNYTHVFYRGCRTFSLVVLYTTVQTKIDSSLSKIADLISGVVHAE